MSRLTTSLVAAAVIGQLVGLLGWIDPLFIPLVLVAPIVSGAVAAARRISYAWIAVLWCSAGINMAWTDEVVNHEDLGFHLALAVVMPLIAGAGYGAVRLATRVRRTA
ncbi:MAG: hypothetical protein JO222_13985 [Frankiales bacterium]|nr:hypothetical protein [Frankiales bacterium]